jgi:DNA-binding NtrC family response regulator
MTERQSEPARGGKAAADPGARGDAEVILVDADPAYRKLMAMRLCRGGLICHTFSSPSEVIEFLNGPRGIKLVIMDHEAASHNGGMLLKLVRTKLPHAAVVGSSATNRRLAFQAIGVEHFLQKPWTEEDLRRILDS